MAGESISIPILTPGADTAARGIKKVGDAAAETGAKLDFAAGSLKAFNDATVKAAKADQTLVQSAKTHAKALALVDDAYRVLDGKATQTTKLFADQGRQFDDTAKKTVGLGARFAALGGNGGAGLAAGGGMGALIGAGVALSGQITTLGFGFGGLALAAAGVVRPIEKAAQASGGLQKNLHTLDPQQQSVAKSLLGLEHQYDSFQQSLQPQILTGFNDAFRIAGHLMHDVQPVAAATGRALDQMLLAIDKEFQSGTWQQFFTWMAQQAGPDIRLLSQNFTDLLDTLPPLIKDLNPLGTAILHVSDDAIRATHSIVSFYDSFQKNVPISNQNVGTFLQNLDRWTVNLTSHIPGARAVNDWLTNVQRTLTGTAPVAEKTATGFTHIAHAAGGMVSPMNALGKVVPDLARSLDAVDHNGRPVVTNFDQQISRLKGLVTGYGNALTALENYINAQITEAGDLQSLNQALKLSHDRIGLKTQAERNSYSAAQTYIKQTTDEGNAALAAHKGIQGQIDVIERAIPRLEAVKGKTAEYKAELDKLKSILDRLRQEKLISEVVRVTGQGTWRFGAAPGGSVAGPGGKFAPAGGRAAGGMITGGSAGRDSVPIMAMPGEVVVPTGMVRAGAVDHLRGALPGFAGGGIIGSYGGPVAGLPPWTSRNQQATILAIGTSIGNAMASSFTAASGFGTAGPGGGNAAANAALARRMMPAWGSGQMWAAWNAVAMAESGWNQFARNPSSGAYGIPQALPPSKMGPAANPPQSNPAAQISWMVGYIQSRYGNPIAAANHEAMFHWYDRGGYLPTGLSLAYNGTGRPEMVVPGGGGSRASGTTIIQHISVGHGTHPADAARAIVELINTGARSGIKIRRSAVSANG